MIIQGIFVCFIYRRADCNYSPLSPPVCVCVCKMNVGVAHSEVNPNTRVMNSRGIWLTYLLLTVVLHIVLLSIPFFTVPLVWTLTNVIHNMVSYFGHWATNFSQISSWLLSFLIFAERIDFKCAFMLCRWCTCFYIQWRELLLKPQTKAKPVFSHTGNR